MDSDRRQLEINIEADDIVTEVIQAAIIQIRNWESRTLKEPGNKYTAALRRIEIAPDRYMIDYNENPLEPELTCRKKSKKTVVNFRDPSIDVSDSESSDEGDDEQEQKIISTDDDEDEVTRL